MTSRKDSPTRYQNPYGAPIHVWAHHQPSFQLGRRPPNWFFAVGFAGIGLSISIDDMKKAGGSAFLIGSGAATAKMILGLIVVLALGTALLQVGGGS